MAYDLVARWDWLLKSDPAPKIFDIRSIDLRVLIDHIKALTADFALQVQRTDEQREAYEQALSLVEADNARLKAALTGIKRAAAHRMQNDRRDLHSYYFHTADAALNTGKADT